MVVVQQTQKDYKIWVKPTALTLHIALVLRASCRTQVTLTSDGLKTLSAHPPCRISLTFSSDSQSSYVCSYFNGLMWILPWILQIIINICDLLQAVCLSILSPLCVQWPTQMKAAPRDHCQDLPALGLACGWVQEHCLMFRLRPL